MLLVDPDNAKALVRKLQTRIEMSLFDQARNDLKDLKNRLRDLKPGKWTKDEQQWVREACVKASE